MQLDPILIEILRNKLTAIAEEMGITLQRTGRTLYVKETADFGTALATPAGKFFACPVGIGVAGFVDLDCATTVNAVGPLAPSSGAPSPRGERTVRLRDERFDAAIFARDDLRPGHRLIGPAIVEQTDTTVWVPPAWQATVHGDGTLELGHVSAQV